MKLRKIALSSVLLCDAFISYTSLADVWHVTLSGGTTGVWARESGPNINPAKYNETWTNSSCQHGAKEIINRIGDYVSIFETWNMGGNCSYTGNISNQNASGTYICGNQPPLPWQATIYNPTKKLLNENKQNWRSPF